MNTAVKIALCIVVAGSVGIQFFPAEHNEKKAVTDQDFSKIYKPPEGITRLLKTSCYDCHSNQTNYPWYSNVQPVGWLLQSHIEDGKKELNFSTFGSLSSRMKKLKIKSMISQIEDGEMPLPSYLYIHREAGLTDEESEKIVAYLGSLQQPK